MIAALVQGVFSLVVAYYAAYALLELRMVLLARKCEKARLTEIDSASADLADGSRLPTVSVLLPVHNESLVVGRLIDAVCQLHVAFTILDGGLTRLDHLIAFQHFSELAVDVLDGVLGAAKQVGDRVG